MNFLEKNKDISELSNFKTPAKTTWYFEVNSEDDLDKLKQIVDFAESEDLKILFIAWKCWWGCVWKCWMLWLGNRE